MKKFTSKQFDKLQEKLELKKSITKTTDPIILLPFTEKEEATKGRYIYENDEDKGIVKRTIVANTYYWMDSHEDVHLSGIFSRSLKHKGVRIPHLHDHKFEIGAKVGKFVSIEEKQISWRELGQGKTGMTEALIAVSEIKKNLNEKIYGEYLSDEIDQHSVLMRYIDIALAVNDKDNYPKEYEVWQEVYPKLGNRQAADDLGYFFAVSEAALHEISAVLAGSNELTPTLKGSPEGTQIDPPSSTQLKAVDLLKFYNPKI